MTAKKQTTEHKIVYSRLAPDQFHDMLTQVVYTERNTLIKAFTISDKPFRGSIDKNKFELTSNHSWTNSKGEFYINGTYKDASAGNTEVSYEIEAVGFASARLLIFICVLVALNASFLIEIDTLQPELILLANLILACVFFIYRFSDRRMARNLEREFFRTLHIVPRRKGAR